MNRYIYIYIFEFIELCDVSLTQIVSMNVLIVIIVLDKLVSNLMERSNGLSIKRIRPNDVPSTVKSLRPDDLLNGKL